MQETVESGTGTRAQLDDYTVGGKTGTAEKIPRSAGTYIVSFCGFAPVSDPQFTVLVILDDPDKYSFGGTTAAPVFKEIMERLLAMKAVPPDQLDFE